VATETAKANETATGEAHTARWGMAIDLDRCTGCEACVLACHAENNIPLSDEASSAMGRANHWIRIDRYYEGEFPNIKVKYRPVLCQQCDDAPCEPVCPVYATYQNAEGLNVQVYNRCVGTRYCANNCPYTVRFFNWFDPVWPEPLELQLNPDVSIRPGGVMEKCTFCIQRIQRGQRDAKHADRALADGDVQPACVQSCPAEAMVFGDLSDSESKVSQWAESGRAGQLLAELGTRPRVFYLERAK
jgi:molybdopterin-containing oxidoreductase family iron-sulfur binding subunit